MEYTHTGDDLIAFKSPKPLTQSLIDLGATSRIATRQIWPMGFEIATFFFANLAL
jgi:hypothetical protein